MTGSDNQSVPLHTMEKKKRKKWGIPLEVCNMWFDCSASGIMVSLPFNFKRKLRNQFKVKWAIPNCDFKSFPMIHLLAGVCICTVHVIISHLFRFELILDGRHTANRSTHGRGCRDLCIPGWDCPADESYHQHILLQQRNLLERIDLQLLWCKYIFTSCHKVIAP